MGILDAPTLTHPAAPYLLNFKPALLRKWMKAVVDVRSGAADARLLCVGDSTTTGARSSTDATVPQWRSWPAQLADAMNAHIPTARGLATPKSTSSSQTADTRWTLGASWSLNPGSIFYVGFGGKGMFYRGSGATPSNLVFADSTIVADTFDIYYQLLPSSGSQGVLYATATGGTQGTANTALAGGNNRIGKLTVSAASAGTGNTVTITHDANKTINVVGIEPYLSTTRKVRVGNAGASGSTTTDWVTLYQGLLANTYGGLDSIKAYAPHLTIIDLGINNAVAPDTTAATFSSQLQQIIAAAQVSGDVILKTMLPSNAASGRVALEQQYIAAMRGLGLPVIDMNKRAGDGDAYFAAGYMNGDGIHGNDYSYGETAAMVLTALRAI